ncbi:unnamed protein product [Rotaria socialis]|nr:unnamed protein product [Rotaria socialis]CAF3344940.1 unnamed protein product [Rotaria socialis]CAF3431404.1 unnamed protein product [Rotaria socialis]CAF3690812.1 unnamed protein product [Rotaria socialis]CAF4494252.1 unnamed protein product [Rotaria socialis]
MRINFYDLNGPYAEFCNWYPAPMELDGRTWPTVEHYFQAQKYVFDQAHFECISQLTTPQETIDYSRAHSSTVRPDWHHVKNEVMLKACMAKFQQHPKLKELLLLTGDSMIIEHTANDSYWGDGGDGTGRNQLGITLMLARTAIINQERTF